MANLFFATIHNNMYVQCIHVFCKYNEGYNYGDRVNMWHACGLHHMMEPQFIIASHYYLDSRLFVASHIACL